MRAALVTGAAGGIGRELCRAFDKAGWRVLATDLPGSPAPGAAEFLPADLAGLVADPGGRARFASVVRRALGADPLGALVNNAAVQRLGATASVSVEDWDETFRVNVAAPFFLVQEFLPELEAARGSVVNVASIHATSTKPGFVAYAASKAALAGLTRAMAVDLGGRVRVNALCPAAISTAMLEAGFEGRAEERRQLDACHPAGRVGTPGEVARAALFLAEGPEFLNGACLGLDGGLAARLHDPV
jgi:NAD(P)-dependent dehydrogenase (short-subunit alcohol dehydrogenase family)